MSVRFLRLNVSKEKRKKQLEKIKNVDSDFNCKNPKHEFDDKGYCLICKLPHLTYFNSRLI